MLWPFCNWFRYQRSRSFWRTINHRKHMSIPFINSFWNPLVTAKCAQGHILPWVKVPEGTCRPSQSDEMLNLNANTYKRVGTVKTYKLFRCSVLVSFGALSNTRDNLRKKAPASEELLYKIFDILVILMIQGYLQANSLVPISITFQRWSTYLKKLRLY